MTVKKVYVFGNKDVPDDRLAFDVADKLKKDFKDVVFEEVSPNEDVPFLGEDPVYILDVVEGITKPELITEDKLNALVLSSSSTVHDYDLGFQLKYLRKLGKIGKVYIIGIPKGNDSPRVGPGESSTLYDSIQSIFKKLVAQDMQGS